MCFRLIPSNVKMKLPLYTINRGSQFCGEFIQKPETQGRAGGRAKALQWEQSTGQKEVRAEPPPRPRGRDVVAESVSHESKSPGAHRESLLQCVGAANALHSGRVILPRRPAVHPSRDGACDAYAVEPTGVPTTALNPNSSRGRPTTEKLDLISSGGATTSKGDRKSLGGTPVYRLLVSSKRSRTGREWRRPLKKQRRVRLSRSA